jgi:hypothetical protein
MSLIQVIIVLISFEYPIIVARDKKICHTHDVIHLLSLWSMCNSDVYNANVNVYYYQVL